MPPPGRCPGDILGRCVGSHRPRRQEPSFDRTGFLSARQVIHRLAVRRHERIEIDQMAHPVGKPVGDARRHHAAVTVTNEDHVPPILVFEHCSHVLDMGLEIDHRMREMGALAEACVGGGDELVAGGPQQWPHLLPRPASAPGAMANHVNRHVVSLVG